jgi:hypothetical protein
MMMPVMNITHTKCVMCTNASYTFKLTILTISVKHAQIGGTSRCSTTMHSTDTTTHSVDSTEASNILKLTASTNAFCRHCWRHQRRQQLPQTVTVMPSATCSTFNVVKKAHAVSGDYDVHTSVAAGHLVPTAILFGPRASSAI